MSSLSPKDRVSLCMFTYADGRLCRTPRISSHPHFCFDHAQKEARAATADKLAKDLAAFFSGHYISANDLSSALARLIPAVLRGDIKARTARTVAYMAQTLLQSIHYAQSEFHDAFGPDNFRKAIRSGIASNHDRLYPPEAPATSSAHVQPASAPVAVPVATQAAPAAVQACHPACPEERRERSEGSLFVSPAPTTDKPSPTPQTQPTSDNKPAAPKRASPQPQPTIAPPATSQLRPTTAHRDPYAVHFDHTCRLREPEKAY